MAKIILNSIVERAQGKMDNIVFRRSHTGEMSVAKLPDMFNVKWSKAQKDSSTFQAGSCLHEGSDGGAKGPREI